jgi:hypothetical protein
MGTMLGCERPAAVRASRRKRSREQLDRDQAIQRHVPREQHDAHAAPAQLALDRVAAREDLLERQELRADGGGHAQNLTHEGARPGPLDAGDAG